MVDRIADACAMQLAQDPWQFDVIVTTILFGAILSRDMDGSASMGQPATGRLGRCRRDARWRPAFPVARRAHAAAGRARSAAAKAATIASRSLSVIGVDSAISAYSATITPRSSSSRCSAVTRAVSACVSQALR